MTQLDKRERERGADILNTAVVRAISREFGAVHVRVTTTLDICDDLW